MQKTTKANILEYRDVVNRLYFPQGDVKKFNRQKFEKEIISAAHYGAVCALQNLLLNEDFSHEELIGEAQLKMLESYAVVKDILKIRLPKIEVEDVLCKKSSCE